MSDLKAAGGTMKYTFGSAVPASDTTAAQQPSAQQGGASGDLNLIVGSNSWAGWESVRVTRGIERCPSDFQIAVTERYPGQVGKVDIQPGQACTIEIGSDLVLTGYVDRYSANLGTNGHEVRINGRSKCQDLVDCAAGFLTATTDMGGGRSAAHRRSTWQRNSPRRSG